MCNTIVTHYKKNNPLENLFNGKYLLTHKLYIFTQIIVEAFENSLKTLLFE